MSWRMPVLNGLILGTLAGFVAGLLLAAAQSWPRGESLLTVWLSASVGASLGVVALSRVPPRYTRLMLGAVAPAPVGAALAVLVIVALSANAGSGGTAPQALLGIGTLFAYSAVGLQSVLYSLLMELVVNPRAKRSLIAIFWSALIGGMSSLPLSLAGIGGMFVSAVGVAAGAIVGGMLRLLYLWQVADQRERLSPTEPGS